MGKLSKSKLRYSTTVPDVGQEVMRYQMVKPAEETLQSVFEMYPSASHCGWLVCTGMLYIHSAISHRKMYPCIGKPLANVHISKPSGNLPISKPSGNLPISKPSGNSPISKPSGNVLISKPSASGWLAEGN